MIPRETKKRLQFGWRHSSNWDGLKRIDIIFTGKGIEMAK